MRASPRTMDVRTAARRPPIVCWLLLRILGLAALVAAALAGLHGAIVAIGRGRVGILVAIRRLGGVDLFRGHRATGAAPVVARTIGEIGAGGALAVAVEPDALAVIGHG